LGWYRDGRLIRVPIDTQASIFIAASRTGGIWIATAERLLKWDDGQVTVVRDSPAWLPATALAQQLLEDRAGVLWIGTRRQGLFRLAEGKLVAVPTEHYQISALAEDGESNLWVGVGGNGISRLRRKTFTLLDTATGFPDNESSSVCEDAAGAIWCADRRNGLVRVLAGQTRVFARTETSAAIDASNVCPDRDDNLWIGTLTGLYQLPVDRAAAIRLLDAAIRPVRSLYCTRDGDMWVGSGGERTQGYQLGFFRQGVYRPFSKADGFPGKHVVALTEATDGTVWIGTYDGDVLEYRDGKFVQRLAGAVTLAGHIHALHFDASGALWLASERGLILMSGDRVRRFTRADGLPDDLITQMLEDNHGRLWLCSRRGFFSVAIDDLKAVADGRSQRVVATTFGKEEGLPGFSAPIGGQPMAWKARDGRLWFVTDRGVVGFDPEASLPERPPPTVYIDEAFVDNRSAPVGAGLSLPPGRHQVEFRFVALNYSAPEKAHLRHQLVGFDQDWVETGAGYAARYARLAPGNYSLRVIAANQDGRWSPQGATLSVVVASAWWQTWWFRSAAFLAAIGVVVGIVLSWSHRRLKRRLEQLEREHALDKERARIARDLHDELGGSLTQIGLLADRLNRHSGGAESDAFGQMARRTRRLAGELESIVWTVNPKNDTWDKLALFLGEFAGRFFQDTPVECLVQGAETVPPRPLAPDVQHHLLSVTKEALNNILKHSRASRAKIVIGSAGGEFTLTIEDNGVGFEPDSLEHAERNGLANMRTRIAEIGGAIAISSVRGDKGRALKFAWPSRPGRLPDRHLVVVPPIGIMPTTVAIVEDNAGICEELEQVLAEDPDCTCVGVCRNMQTALRKLPLQAPEVIIMDIQLPDGSGIECTARLKRLLPATQILMFTIHDDSEQIFRSLEAGASGYLLKRTAPEDLLDAIREVKHGSAPMTGAIARKVIQFFHKAPTKIEETDRLTPRETEILELLATGRASKEIAGQLSIGLETVNSHLKHIYEKLHVRSRTEAVIKYLH
jgi:DNA-binding NarL/FixJ family response regulator/signal transduction histidine kinase/streptogramin lyase